MDPILTDKKVFIKTYGCHMNVYDSDKIHAVLTEHKMKMADTPETADLILINTCSVREKAQEKLFSELGRYRDMKKKRPEIKIGVGGCVGQQEGKLIFNRAPYVDLVFGPQTIHRLADLYLNTLKTKERTIDTSFPEIEKFDHLPAAKKKGPCAFVSIMEGCSKYCSFCVVPYTRGEEISRPFDDVLKEVMHLVKIGAKEITLLGQNVNDYHGLMSDGSYASLALLIHYIASIDDLKRIRFMTSHPNAFSDDLIDAYASEPKLANQLHLPVQSGSDRILALMKRNYTAEDFIQKIEKLRLVRPNIPVSSDFIVGFPNETKEDFSCTMDLVKTIGFDQSYSFIYSPRPGTPAASIPDFTPLEEKKERLKALQDLLNTQAQNYAQAMVGNTYPVLITGMDKKGRKMLTGRTENNRVVNFAGNIRLIGQIMPILITEAMPNSLRGSCEHN